jgi:hypothetical protein
MYPSDMIIRSHCADCRLDLGQAHIQYSLMTWKQWQESNHGLYLTCGCGWAKDVDPEHPNINANPTWMVKAVTDALPCPTCQKKGLVMTITSPWR